MNTIDATLRDDFVLRGPDQSQVQAGGWRWDAS